MALQDISGGHVVITGGAVPTAAAGANNGSTPPAPVIGTAAEDARGTLTFGSGGSPAAGVQCVVSFGVPYGPNLPVVTLMPLNSVTAALQLYATAVAGGGFSIGSVNAPSASQANTVYSVAWEVEG